MKRKIILYLISIFSLIVFLSSTRLEKKDIGAVAAVQYFSDNATLFSNATDILLASVDRINRDSATVIQARAALLNCRIHFKRIAFFTSYFFPSETRIYNAAPKYEVEEPELEFFEPMGLQQIEALLFDDDVYAHKAELLGQVKALSTSVRDLKSLLYQFSANDRQILESVRLELIRMMTLYISGYDAPLLKSGISETLESCMSLEKILAPYFKQDELNSRLLSETLHSSVNYLQAYQQFNEFDRMVYLVKYALPLQEQLGLFIQTENLELNTSAYLNYNAPNLFSQNFLKSWDSIAPANRKQLSALGKQLFFDKGLSGNLKVSCATCHQPRQYFADGKIKSASLIRDTVLKRNTPSLLYAGFQHTQFWDGRSKTIVAQIKDVLFNPLEMGGTKTSVYRHIASIPKYSESFKNLFPESGPDEYPGHIAVAITAFISGLNPLDSPFDRYIAGDKKAMSKAQIKGFNLFMGKAQCATCHFPPYFNSLVPPFYDISEIEVLGTTKTDDLTKPEYDTDMGRFDLYKVRYYKQAFKTPTVRNAQKTAPYMHNGAFKTLENVLDFYNKGGANGIGLNTPDQTLSSIPLNLTKQESDQIIQFINSLTDTGSTQALNISK